MDYKIESETTCEITAALAKAQKTFKPATKSKTNPFFKTKYADLQEIEEAIQPGLSENDLAFTSSTVRIDGKSVLIGTLKHKSGEFFRTYQDLYHKEDMQSYGGAKTYARRYAIIEVCNIVTEDDDGESSMARKQEPIRQLNESEISDIEFMLMEVGEEGLQEKLLDWLQVDSIAMIKSDKFPSIIKKLREKLNVKRTKTP